jgi:hypothetical protein
VKRRTRFHESLTGAGILVGLYCAAYVAVRPHATAYAPYAWGRPKPIPLTSSIIYYPIVSKVRPSPLEGLAYRVRPVLYYAFSPLVEADLAINNHPGNPFPHWTVFGSNWP